MTWDSSGLTKEKRTLVLVNFALVLSQVCFGGFEVLGKYALAYIEPIIFSFYRDVFTGPILFIVATIVEKVKPARNDMWKLVLLGIVVYGDQVCFTIGLKLTNSATQTAIMQQCVPVITSAMTVALRMEKFSFTKLVGLIFAVAGAMVMIGFKDFSLDNNHTLGMLFLLGNTVLTSTYFVMQKPVLAKYPPMTVTAYVYIVASIAMGLTSLYYIHDLSNYAIPKNVIGALAYAVGMQTVFGYVVSWANSRAPASLVSMYTCLQPLVTYILARIFVHETFIWNDGVGMALVITGLALVTWARARESGAENAKNEKSDESEKSEKESMNEKTRLLSVNVDVDAESKT